ncbi:MAG: hypothetical protein ACNI27_07050 [Desulfovibrio sp.]
MKHALLLFKLLDKEWAYKLHTQGELFIRKASEFQRIEDSNRGDKNENINAIYQKDEIQLTIAGHTIKSSDLAGPIIINDDIDPFIYCTYALEDKRLKESDCLIDEACYSFGDHCVVVHDIAAFQNRIRDWCIRNGARISAEPIQYVDLSKHSGRVGPYIKDFSYQHQQEYRLVFYDIPTQDSTFTITLGDLSDITKVIPTALIEKEIEITYT